MTNHRQCPTSKGVCAERAGPRRGLHPELRGRVPQLHLERYLPSQRQRHPGQGDGAAGAPYCPRRGRHSTIRIEHHLERELPALHKQIHQLAEQERTNSNTLQEVLSRLSRLIVIYYFCGMNVDHDQKQGSGREGPETMLSSKELLLLMALQERRVLDLSFIVEAARLCADVSASKPDALFWLLGELLRCALRQIAVYCILDGVHWQEDEFGGHGELNGARAGCAFKVPMMSAAGTDFIAEKLSGLQHVSVGTAKCAT